MRVLTFMPCFWDKIKAGEKLQTCRRRAGCVPGDTLSMRGWSGRPYMTPQIKLLEPVVCRKVVPVVIEIHDGDGASGLEITLGGRILGEACKIYFARADGFCSRLDMMRFFGERYPRMVKQGEPFEGDVIYWGAA